MLFPVLGLQKCNIKMQIIKSYNLTNECLTDIIQEKETDFLLGV